MKNLPPAICILQVTGCGLTEWIIKMLLHPSLLCLNCIVLLLLTEQGYIFVLCFVGSIRYFWIVIAWVALYFFIITYKCFLLNLGLWFHVPYEVFRYGLIHRKLKCKVANICKEELAQCYNVHSYILAKFELVSLRNRKYRMTYSVKAR